MSSQQLNLGTFVLLVTAPLLWAGNALVARLLQDLVPPVLLQFKKITLIVIYCLF